MNTHVISCLITMFSLCLCNHDFFEGISRAWNSDNVQGCVLLVYSLDLLPQMFSLHSSVTSQLQAAVVGGHPIHRGEISGKR